jgi:hypothetical protein
MNELYATDPNSCTQVSDLKFLLNCFGPYTGRYLIKYPSDWGVRVEDNFKNAGDLALAKVKALLRRANEDMTLVSTKKLPWIDNHDWMQNAWPLLKEHGSIFDGLVSGSEHTHADHPAICHLHELDLAPTAEERILGTPQEYARVAKFLVLLSPELVLVDPYLNPIKKNCKSVLGPILKLAAQGKCQKVTIWARTIDEVGDALRQAQVNVKNSLSELANEVGFRGDKSLELFWVSDEISECKMHARYLLSIKGGIRLDQGFQQLPKGRRVDVSPVGKDIHMNLLDIFFDGKHDMQITSHMKVDIS